MNGISNQRNIAFGATPKQLERYLKSRKAKELGVKAVKAESGGRFIIYSLVAPLDLKTYKNPSDLLSSSLCVPVKKHERDKSIWHHVELAIGTNAEEAFNELAKRVGKIADLTKKIKSWKKLERQKIVMLHKVSTDKDYEQYLKLNEKQVKFT